MTKLIKPTPSNNLVRGWSTAGSGHRGIDYGWMNANPEETQKILCAAPGRVLDVYSGSGFNGGWGRRARVDHGHGAVTTYNHVRPNGFVIAQGMDLSAGQFMGMMGSSGAAQGTHLHFELYLNGVRVDPAPYFSVDLPGTGADTGAPAGNTGGGSGQRFQVPAEGQYYYWQYNNALNGNYDRSQLLRGGQSLEVVENPGTGPVRVRCADGDLVWVGTRNNPAVISGGSAPAPAPASQWFDVPGVGQYYYNQYNNALNGNYDRNQLIPRNAGALRVLENPGTGPVKVDYKGGVWVGTRNNPARVR